MFSSSIWPIPAGRRVFQPTYAAYLNLIEPWWKTLRTLAFKGRRFEDWPEMARAVEQATAYGNAHRHPRSEEHTSELQSQFHLVCRLLLEKKKTKNQIT